MSYCMGVNQRDTPMTLQPGTEHLPCSPDLSPADLAAERFRANTSERRYGMPEVPEQYQETFTPDRWKQFLSDRFWSHHSYGVCLTPEDFLSGMTYQKVQEKY